MSSKSMSPNHREILSARSTITGNQEYLVSTNHELAISSVQLIDGSQKTQIVDANDVNLGTAANPLHTTTNDTFPATQNITAQDVGSTTTTEANGQVFTTGTPTVNSVASFLLTPSQTVKVQVTGTWTGTLQSQISLDNGVTWVNTSIHQSGTAYTTNNFTDNFIGGLNVSGCTHFRIRSTAAWTGTATVKIIETPNDNSIYVANDIGIQDRTTPTQKLAVSAGGAASMNQTQINGVTVSAGNGGSGTGVQRVTIANDSTGILTVLGNVADDSAATGNPIQVAGYAKPMDGTSPGTVSAEDDVARLTTDLNRRLYVNTVHPALFRASENHTTAQTNNELVASPGAGLSIYVTDVIFSNGATAGDIKLVQDTGGTPTDVLENTYVAINGGAVINFNTPIKLSANVNLGFTSTTVTTHSVTVTGFVAP